jgi:Zn-dependent protease
MWDIVLDGSAWVLPVLVAVLLHEIAHGWMAKKFGDGTARQAGRLTLNPIKHIDLWGTIIIPLLMWIAHAPFLFGSAKPVPVNFRQLKPQRLGMFMVAIAGPATNVILAFIMGLLLHIEAIVTPEQAPWLFMNIYRCLMLNCVLATFNMIPILPLDGGRALSSMLTGRIERLYSKLERTGLIILMLVLIVPSLLGYNMVQDLLLVPPSWLMSEIMTVTGNNQ